MPHKYCSVALITLLNLNAAVFAAQPSGNPKAEPIVARLFFQDQESATIRWANIRNGVPPTMDPVQDVSDFPKIDTERQGLVQMRSANGYLLVGIRDDDGGAFGSGWALVSTGVAEEPHGDHSHWRYTSNPTTRHTLIDENQGNPAHLYEYDNVFYIANDQKQGYTRLDPSTVTKAGNVPTGFHTGGGGHITLAVANGVGYGTWIDGGGPNAGRVDLTSIRATGNEKSFASITLPSGVIHGATAAGGKVFFAPADGVCWVDASAPSASMKVNHLSLGKNPETEKPYRTGAFAVYLNRVLFVTGDGSQSKLGIIDSRAPAPKLVTLELKGEPGTKPVTPACIRTSRGKHYAFIFQDAPGVEDSEDEADRPKEQLTVIDLDPNKDGRFDDATIAQQLTVGASKVEGHNGHHSIAFDSDGRRAYFTNPGDGTITILRLDNLEPAATLPVDGTPTSLLAVGGRETHD